MFVKHTEMRKAFESLEKQCQHVSKVLLEELRLFKEQKGNETQKIIQDFIDIQIRTDKDIHEECAKFLSKEAAVVKHN